MDGKNGFDTEEERWQAVKRRDGRAAGSFLYAVTSTGVYCRPGCASRRPQRRNVRFFDTDAEAWAAGFRPCLRCRPGKMSPEERLQETVVRACRRLETSTGKITVKNLSEDAGLSPSHFHRVFKRFVGVTPGQYAAGHRAARFRRSLAHGGKIADAVYEAGYSSGSRAYQAVGRRMGMKPSSYRRGAVGEHIRYGIAPCSLGWIIVGATDRGVCCIKFGDHEDGLAEELHRRFPGAVIAKAGPAFKQTLLKAVELVEHPARDIKLPLDIQGTAFQERVWQVLGTIAPGTTMSYREVAKRVGNPAAVRAVAQACGANKVAVAIPCHRVVRSDGSLGGYRGGLWRKEALLKKESETTGDE